MTRREWLRVIGRDLLRALGEDPTRTGLCDTPRRFADLWADFIEYDPGTVDATFETVRADQMVVISGLRVWSMCEHHLLPFWADVSIGVLTGDCILGLSKFARVAHACAHRLQVQERLVEDIAQQIATLARTPHVAVVARGVHLCMVMRGIRTPGVMTTSVMHGRFRECDATRAEFLRLVSMADTVR